ncbi:MAG: tetratricopeptide repeat protein, partial [Bacteroidaceae bacterium]|nr:tetratricopeptide repeat protein [Bacteroidaceae bacterium]
MGLILYESGKTDEAIALYKSVIEKYPNAAEAQTALANLKDIFTAKGRINEYATLAASVGKSLSVDELDAMVLDAALRALSEEDAEKAGLYYRQLREQTQSDDMRQKALVGELRTAVARNDNSEVVAVADIMLQDGAKMPPDVAAEARFSRSMSNMNMGNTEAAVADWTLLSSDPRTVYGAEAAVRLAQYSYETKQYEEAESLLLSFIDSGTPHAYWLARGFILLADVYSATERKVEAR